MAKANIPVSFSPVDSKKVEAALARIQSQAKGVNFGKGAESINKLSRPLGKITGQASEFQKSLEASNARVLAFGASVAVINKLSQAFGALVSNTIKVEASFAKINTILGGTQKQLEQFGNGIFKVAQRTATSFDQVAEGALELARQGLSVEESLSRVETALKLVRVAGIDSQQAVAGLTAAIKGFESAGLTVAAIGDKLAEVDTKFAVSTEDLINGLERASASARVAGVSFDELLAAVTTVQERTQRGGAVIGNAFKTIFARLGRTDTLQALQDLGISVLDTEGNVRSAVPLFQELATELDKLGLKSIEAGEVIQKVAGVRQRDILISLVEDLNSGQSQFAKALQVSAGAVGSLDTKNAKLNDTLEALINNLAVGGQKLASVLGEIGFTDQAKDLLKLFGDIVNSITDVLQGDTIGSKFAKGLIKGIGATLTPGIALVGAIFTKLFIDLAKFGGTSLKQILGINKAAQAQNSLQQSVLQTLLQNENIQREILALEGNKVAQEQLLLKIYNQQAAALARVQKAAATVTPGLFGAGLRGGERGVTRRGAGGYISAESRDVSRGVGGAPASSRVVSIPNFAFGGGQRGTMVANTSEYYVPNYKGGGDAIFNKDMVRSMGLPGGAKKLNAAGGFIPNFARRQATPISDPRFVMITPSKSIGKTAVGKAPSGRSYSFPILGYNDAKLRGTETKDFVENVKQFGIALADKEALIMTGGNPEKTKVEKLGNAGSVSSLAGVIYEAAVSSILKSKDYDLSETATFDFVGEKARKDIAKIYPNIPGQARFIEAKISGNSRIYNSMAKKMEKFGAGQKTLPRAGVRELIVASNRATPSGKAIKGEFNRRSARGYIPNFFGGALEEAINREEEAGVPLNQIRVNQSGKLRNAKNPKGLAVTNTRDEPTGKIPNFNKRGMGDGMGGGLAGIFVAQAIGGMVSSFVDAESAAAKFTSALTTSLTALASVSLITPSIGDFSSKLTGVSKSLKATTLTFDKSAKRFRNASGQFASTSAGRSMANRGRGFAAGAAAVGGRALGALGPIAMVASVAIPLVMALKNTEKGFSSLSKELNNLDLSKLSGGGLMGEFVRTIELNLEKRAQADKIRTDAGIKGKGKNIDQILGEQLGELRVARSKRRTSDPDRFRELSDLEKSFISPSMIAAIGFDNVQKAIEEATIEVDTAQGFGIDQDVFLQEIVKLAKATDGFKSAAAGIKEAQEARIAASLKDDDASNDLSILNIRNVKAAQRAGLASRREGTSGADMNKSQQMALKLAGNLGRLERQRLEANKAILDAQIQQTEAGRKLGSELGAAAINATKGVVGNTAMAEAIKTAVEDGEKFEVVLEKVNKLKEEGEITDSNAQAALKEIISSYEDQNDELDKTAKTTADILNMRKKMADMSPLDAANAQRRNDLKELSEEVPKRLADNLENSIGNAMNNLADGTYDSLGDVFLNIALDFGRALQQEISAAVAKNLVQSFTGGPGKGFMNAIGSFFAQPKASGGLVSGGSGVMDDVPAMLTGGEFVIKKSSVQKYGVDFLDKLNSGGIQGFQNGGSLMIQGADNVRTGRFFDDPRGYSAGGARSRAFLEEAKKRDFFVPGQRGFGSIVGKENLLAFSQQGVTSGATDIISTGPGGASLNLEDQSARLTAFGRRRDSPAKRALQEAQAQAFDLYQRSAAEEQRVIEENRQAKKARTKALQQAIVGAFVNATMAGVSAGISNYQNTGSFFGPSSPTNLQTAAAGTIDGVKFGAGESINTLGPAFTRVQETQKSFLGLFDYTSKQIVPTSMGRSLLDSASNAASTGGSYIFNTAPFVAANGGLMSGGGSNSANALLMDGEYVMGSEAASSLGRDTLSSINLGNFANGGAVGGSTASGSNGGNADVGTLNIEINIEKDGTASASASGSGEEDPEKAKEFSKKVKDVVLSVITEEKRVSGSLFTRNK